MGKCKICGSDYWCETESEPEESCWCGEMCNCNLWEWDKWKAIKKFLIYRTAEIFYWVGSRILDLAKENSIQGE
jgi:hypothetical protein